MPAIQYMELRNPAKNQKKFWEVTAPYSSLYRGMNEPTFPGYKVVCRWGRIDTHGQSKPFYFEELRDAEAFVDSKLREKQREGYTTVSRAIKSPNVAVAMAAYAPIPDVVCAACGAQAVRLGDGTAGVPVGGDIGDAPLCIDCWHAPFDPPTGGVRDKIIARHAEAERRALARALGRETPGYTPIAGAICECCGAGATTDGSGWFQLYSEIDPPARLCRTCWNERSGDVAAKIEHNRRTGELGDRLPLKAQHPNPQDLPDDPFVIPD